MGGAETRRGAAALRPYTTGDFKLEAIYLRPVIARLARIRRLAPVRRNGRRSRVRRGRRTFAMRRHGRRGALRGSGRVRIPAAIVAIVIGVFCLGTVVAIVVDVLGVDYLATPVGGSVLGPLGVERGLRLAPVGCMLVGDLRRLRRQETRQRERDGITQDPAYHMTSSSLVRSLIFGCVKDCGREGQVTRVSRSEGGTGRYRRLTTRLFKLWPVAAAPADV